MQIYEMAQPWFRRYAEGSWRESGSRSGAVLSSCGEIGEGSKGNMWRTRLERSLLESLLRRCRETAVELGSGFSEMSFEETSKRPDHSKCVPREEFCKLSEDLLVGGQVLTRAQAEYLMEREKKRTGREPSKYSVEELLRAFKWTGEIFQEK